MLAVLGIVLALRATKVGRTDYFVLGLTEGIVTAALALTIAVFNLSSRAAVAPACSVLIVNAIASLAMCWWLANRSVHDSPKLSTPAHAVHIQFSIRTLLIATTVCCVLLAVARLLAWRGDMGWFAAYGLGMAAISAVIAIRFSHSRSEARPLVVGVDELTQH
ncbi:MAG: hypothetical protein H0T51_09535 [Pirellulales bacterium]|nr:hypothetical protein [Pirellulales bacterium]